MDSTDGTYEEKMAETKWMDDRKIKICIFLMRQSSNSVGIAQKIYYLKQRKREKFNLTAHLNESKRPGKNATLWTESMHGLCLIQAF